MLKVGFIGTGSMGSLLINAFLASGALDARQIVASNRTHAKVLKLSSIYPGLKAAETNQETVMKANFIFLCVKPHEFKEVAQDIKPFIKPEHILISITSPVQIRHLESVLPCKITKIIPSITHLRGSGASLCIHGNRMKDEDKKQVEQLFSYISRPVQVEESFTRISSDLTSCGPAFIAYFLEQWIQAAVQHTGIDHEDATCLASEMLLGTGKLLTEGAMTPSQLQKRVAVPGGITAKALNLLDSNLAGVFDQLIQVTHAKYEEDLEHLDAEFGAGEINRQQY
ncbi:competence protein ComER [Paenibacillus sp. 453mf]|nr:competence protein ComER [Paenibacillus sp. 453mf]